MGDSESDRFSELENLLGGLKEVLRRQISQLRHRVELSLKPIDLCSTDEKREQAESHMHLNVENEGERWPIFQEALEYEFLELEDGLHKQLDEEAKKQFRVLQKEWEYATGHAMRYRDESNRQLKDLIQKLEQQKMDLQQQQKQTMVEMRNKNDSLQAQIRKLEDKRSKEAAAGRVYSSSEADPTTLVSAAEEIKRSLAEFARTLMQGMAAQKKQHLVQKLHPGIQFSNRALGIKYVFQEWAANLVLVGLWESESFSHKSCPEGGREIEENQMLCFNRYKKFKNATWVHELDAMLDSASSNTSGSHGSVVGQFAAWPDFHLFCHQRWATMIQESPDILDHSKIIELRHYFGTLLLKVWEAHLLTLAFEQPATLFKVKSGTKFSPAHMEAILEPEPNTGHPTVAFMVIPGFRVGKSVIKSLVYLCEDDSPVSAQDPDHIIAAASNSSQTPSQTEEVCGDNMPKQEERTSLKSIRVYRIHPITNAIFVLLVKERHGNLYYPSLVFENPDTASNGPIDAILGSLRDLGALQPQECKSSNILEMIRGRQDRWDILISYGSVAFGPISRSCDTKAPARYRWSTSEVRDRPAFQSFPR